MKKHTAVISKCSVVLPTPILWARAVQIIWQLSQRTDGGWQAFILAFLQQKFSFGHLGYVNLVSSALIVLFSFLLFPLRFHFLQLFRGRSKSIINICSSHRRLIEGIQFLRVSPTASSSSLSNSVRRFRPRSRRIAKPCPAQVKRDERPMSSVRLQEIVAIDLIIIGAVKQALQVSIAD